MKKLFGGLLLAVGILLMTTSGLCSLLVVIGGFQAALQNPGVIMMPLVIGGVPFSIGFGAFWWGRSLLREDSADRF